jgi:hypothetical protein
MAGVAGLERATPVLEFESVRVALWQRVPFRDANQVVGHIFSGGSVSARDA